MDLREYLLDNQIPRQEFAKQIKVSYGFLNKILGGFANPGEYVQKRIEKATDGKVPMSEWHKI